MEYQILTDFILTNTDRHLNNFGVIRDSRTLQLLKPAPIFDSGNSMFYNTSHIKSDYELLNVRVTSFKKHEVELLKYVTNPKLVDISALPSEKEVYHGKRMIFLPNHIIYIENQNPLLKTEGDFEEQNYFFSCFFQFLL